MITNTINIIVYRYDQYYSYKYDQYYSYRHDQYYNYKYDQLNLVLVEFNIK